MAFKHFYVVSTNFEFSFGEELPMPNLLIKMQIPDRIPSNVHFPVVFPAGFFALIKMLIFQFNLVFHVATG